MKPEELLEKFEEVKLELQKSIGNVNYLIYSIKPVIEEMSDSAPPPP